MFASENNVLIGQNAHEELEELGGEAWETRGVSRKKKKKKKVSPEKLRK